MASLSFFIFYPSANVNAGGLESAYAKVTGTNIVPVYKRAGIFSYERTFADAAASVKKGEIDKSDMQLISSLAKEKNPEAIELLAWMNATGTGVSQNFYNAWFLYVEADEMGIQNAKQNADVIYDLITFQRGKK